MSHFEPIQFSEYREFERYVIDYFSILYNTRFSTYGTPGQEQYGIDGLHFGPLSDGKRHVIQCKNLNYSDLTIEIIQKDINKLKELKVEFNVYHFVTSAKKKTKIQNDISNNMDVLTSNNKYEFEIHFYSDFFHDSLQYKKIKDRYFKPFYNDVSKGCHEKDIESLESLAMCIDSSFINLPYYISQVKIARTSAYNTLVLIREFSESVPGGVFYDIKINEYMDMFVDYIDRIYSFSSYYEFIFRKQENNDVYLNYIGSKEEYGNVNGHMDGLAENFAYTFKQFISYLKDNYPSFDLRKNYYINPLP
ncbi:TPA: hypothetical protein N3F83_005809 [Klebsiella variicola subsp. variicola]|uniref:hypothetical protein n=1 Tax=Klebsiella variicola TaxID=244366 RepID=UPI000D747ED5|nr:hypothetical protein [Klebsiella variicola]HCA4368624.1 hypothetical protein [Klebsiella variicola subsp. variicola]MBR7397993.1 hypothetical protein [Klebsiella variicola]PXK87966.1 hypothetical protein DMS44_27340 [Klebsiella variicola]HBU6155323.1 hypothetical protein [Klebsiella variicola]HBU9679763.1 hypothetical protein [Klebsiella variicola]